MELSKERLLDLLAKGESEMVEFKESIGDEALETIGAFQMLVVALFLLGLKILVKLQEHKLERKLLKILLIESRMQLTHAFNPLSPLSNIKRKR